MKKAITIYIDDCVDGVTEICGAIVQRKATGSARIHTVKANMTALNSLYLPWNSKAEWFDMEGDADD